MALKCEKCGGRLKLEENSCVCLECGAVYNFLEEEKEISSDETSNAENTVVPAEEVIEANTENKIEEEIPTTPKKKVNWMGWILGLSLVALLIYAFVWMSGSDERAIKEVLADNGYYDLEIVAVEDLENNIEGLAGNNKFVLIKKPSGEQQYGFGAVNIEDGTFQDSEFGYTPLNVLMLKVFSSGEQMNIDNFNKAKEYVEKYGYYCLNNQENAENYIREITGDNGFLPCEIGRKVIIDNITYILPDIRSLPQFEVIFEDGNANPMYYAGLSSEMKYRWNHVFPESVYKVWEASVDRETQNITKAMYGQPYELQEVWAVVDKNLKEIGTYKSLESAKAALQKTPTTKYNGENSNNTVNSSTTSKEVDSSNSSVSTEPETNKEDGNKPKLIVGTNAQFPPFEYYDDNKNIIGFDIELIKLIGKELGYEIVIKDMEYDALVSAITSNKIDIAISGMIATDERREFVDFSIPYVRYRLELDEEIGDDSYVIAVRKQDTILNKINECIQKFQNDGTISSLKSKYNIN